MSINGLQQQYFANSLDGLTYLDVNGIAINGNDIDIDNLVPYTGANKPIDVGVQPIRTSYIPIVNNDVVNLQTLNQTTTGTVGYVDQYFVPYNGATSDTNLGNKAFTVGIAGNTNLSGLVKTELNNVLAGYNPASIVVGNGFGTITNAGGVYQSTSTGPTAFASLFLGNIIVGEKYRISLSLKCIDPNYNTNIYIYEAPSPNLSGGGISRLSFNIPPNTTGFTVFSGTFIPTTYVNLLLVFNTQIITGINTLYWNAFSLTGMGSVVKNLIDPTTALDGANKRYVDNADALRVPYSGATSNVNLGTNNLIANTAQFTGIINATPSLALGVDGSGNLRSFTVPTPSISGSVSAGYHPFASSANTLANSYMFQNGSDTGLGTTSPADNFHIKFIGCTQRIEATSGDAGLRLKTTGATSLIKTLEAGDLYIDTGASTKNIILQGGGGAGGKVGIGTITPSQKLDVSGDGARIQVESNTANNAVVQIKTNANYSYIFTDQSGHLQMYPGNIAKYLLFQGVGNIGGGSGYAVQNGYMSPGSLTIGDTTRNYGGRTDWVSNTAGLMLECLNNTEIAVHDAGDRVVSLLYYAYNRIYIGRNMGWGATPTTFQTYMEVIGTNGLFVCRIGSAQDGSIYWANPNGSNTHWGYPSGGGSDNYIRGTQTYVDTPVAFNNNNITITGGLPQMGSIYGQPVVADGNYLRRSQCVIREIYNSNSVAWGGGINMTYAFYNYNSYVSVVLTGKYSGYWTSSTINQFAVRIYNQNSGAYYYYYFNTFTNNILNHVSVPLTCNVGNTGTGWNDIYIYNNSGYATDGNDQLLINIMTFPASGY